jgi:hypothetical protein
MVTFLGWEPPSQVVHKDNETPEPQANMTKRHGDDKDDNSERKKLEGRFVIQHKQSNGVEKRKRNHYNPTASEIKERFGMTLSDAALDLNICSTKLKKLCREYGITKWPYRKVINSII